MRKSFSSGSWKPHRIRRVRSCLALLTLLMAGNTFFGQISAADSNSPALRVGMAGFPIVFYTPETSAGLGGGLTLTFRSADAPDTGHPDRISMFMMYTLNRQVMTSVFPEWYFGENWKAGAALAYRHFPDEYFGTGNETPDEGEDFTTRDTVIKPYLLRRITSHAWAGLIYDWKNTDVLEIEPDGLLAQGDPIMAEGSRLSGIGPALEWDSRDHAFSPQDGSLYSLSSLYYREGLDSDKDYVAFRLDGRHYWSPTENRVLAFHWQVSTASGDIPFNEYPRLEELRGIMGSRYRARKALAVQAEYRFPIRGRVSGVTFVSAGEVMDQWDDFTWSGWHPTGGMGLRFALNRKERINLRVDIGIGEDGVYPYIRMMEAF